MAKKKEGLEIKKITRSVISYCDIPEEFSEDFQEYPCGTYVPYKITSVKEQGQFSDDFSFTNWVIENFPELEGRTILVDMDY